HDRQLAVRPPPGGPGGDALPLRIPRHGRRVQRQEVHDRALERSVAVGRGADRAEDAAQSPQERRAVSRGVPLSGGAAQRPGLFMSLAQAAAPTPAAFAPPSDFARELARLDDRIAAAGEGALTPPTDTERVTTYVDALYRRALLTGDLVALERVEQ